MHIPSPINTPGPWTIDNREHLAEIKAGTSSIATVNPAQLTMNDNGKWQDHTEANARLIAAAPDLLAACEAIATLADGQGRLNMLQVAGQARSAIDKALKG